MNLRRSHRRHRGISLIELLVVIAILALLVGLLLGAIQSARLSAVKAAALNDTRQILLAAHNFASSHQDQLPNVNGEAPAPGRSVFEALSPLLEANPRGTPGIFRLKSDPSRPDGSGRVAMPSASGVPSTSAEPTGAECSFALNPFLFAPRVKLSSSVPDGLSSTVALTEHYGVCGPTTFYWPLIESVCLSSEGKRVPCVASPAHRATFADGMYDDVLPVTTNNNGVAITTGSLPLTFQVRPPLHECDPRIPQSSLPGGILAGFADGSARFLRPRIEATVFWSAVTPAGGEVAPLD
jgi:prepilin-type N-terminal cleavage/methylation domain-containing protein